MRRGATWGTLIGCTAWAVLLIALLWGSGRGDLALSVGVPALVISLAIALLVIALMRLARHAHGHRARIIREATLGAGALALAGLMALGNLWIYPALQETKLTHEHLGPVGAHPIPWWIVGLTVLAGFVLLLRAACASRRPPTP